MEISQPHNTIEKKYALLLSMPTLTLLPSGLFERIFFILLEDEPKVASFINKHVALHGDWEGMSFPLSENIAILKVDQISEDLSLNKSPIDEEALCFLEDRIPISVS